MPSIHTAAKIVHGFSPRDLPGDPRQKTALLINPPLYDTQYWAEWAQPYGLLRLVALLRKYGYRRIEFFDFLETDEKRQVPSQRINPGESYAERDHPSSPIKPISLHKAGESLALFLRHFGRSWAQFEAWLDERGLDARRPPEEIWISAVMTYWWEAVRDLTARLVRRFGRDGTIILGGIYPTLAPEHAAGFTSADLVVAGEVTEANDLWTDLSVYSKPPAYAIITPSRGCPYNCRYCAQRTLNGQRRGVDHRPPADIVAEMRDKHQRFGIKEFAFYADSLLGDHADNFQKTLELMVAEKLNFRLHAPEGLDTRRLSQSQRLVDLMKETNFQKIYLPLESIDDGFIQSLNRRHVRLEHFVQAVERCAAAGFRLRNLEVNAFVLYGLPREKIDDVVQTIIFVSEIVGSIIPMLFTPVPSTKIYRDYLPYFQERGWDKNLQMLNGKLYPFLELNEGSLADYIDLQRLMFTLNAHYRSRSFRLFGDTRVSESFRRNLAGDFEGTVRRYRGLVRPFFTGKETNPDGSPGQSPGSPRAGNHG